MAAGGAASAGVMAPKIARAPSASRAGTDMPCRCGELFCRSISTAARLDHPSVVISAAPLRRVMIASAMLRSWSPLVATFASSNSMSRFHKARWKRVST